MTDYEREWTTERGLPASNQLRVGLTKREGVPVRFVVQLEYWHAGAWLPVARFDHNRDGPAYRNVEQVGLHLDLYKPDGTQFDKATGWPPQPADEAMGDAETYLRQRAERFTKRFESWL
jgi:hypothetical protein